MDSFENTDTHVPVEPKRRKVRKGTRSCWACKQRKMKCILNPLTDTICNGCRRRGLKCVSQEYPDTSLPGMGTTFDARTSTMPSEDGRKTDDILTPVSMGSDSLRYLTSSRNCPVGHHVVPIDPEGYKFQFASGAQAGKSERLSRFLHQALPSREDMERICNANRHPSFLGHEILTVPYTILQRNGLRTPESLLEPPASNVHPVLIARHMLQVAIFLQHVHPEFHENISESPQAIKERLADLAISLVTTNDELLSSVEGLECVMIESMYQANVGNLRRAWVAGRRAMGIAQLMGLDRRENGTHLKVLDSNTTYYPELMWFRLVFLDRHLCLMLGLRQGPLDCSMDSATMLADDTPTGRLERLHCIIASQILERNESRQTNDDFALTQTLDVEMQKAARSVPSKWWLAPNLDNIASSDSRALFWDLRRLFAQVLHYNLLNQLHLPYMLRSSSAEHKYDYSRITCVNASREVISRFITLRSFNRIAYSWSCRIVDFLGLMAAMTLLLAHLESQRSPNAQNFLAHQYLTDRAMIVQAQEHMEEVNRLNSDALSAQSAHLLRRLLSIEAETADSARRVSVHDAGIETAPPDLNDNTSVGVHIPYFGIIKIARDGISKELPRTQATTTNGRPTQSQGADGSDEQSIPGLAGRCSTSEIMSQTHDSDSYVNSCPIASQDVPETCTINQHSSSSAGINNVATYWTPQFQSDLSDSILQYEDCPDITAVGADWAFQGVDMAFFNSLMGSPGNEGNGDADCSTWQR